MGLGLGLGLRLGGDTIVFFVTVLAADTLSLL